MSEQTITLALPAVTGPGPDDRSAEGVVRQVKERIASSVERLSVISRYAVSVQSRGRLARWFKDGEQIDKLAEAVSDLAAVQQVQLDLMLALVGAAANMKADYNDILESIDMLSEQNESDITVLSYLKDVKSTVRQLQQRDRQFADVTEAVAGVQHGLVQVHSSVAALQGQLQAELQASVTTLQDRWQARLQAALTAVQVQSQQVAATDQRRSGQPIGRAAVPITTSLVAWIGLAAGVLALVLTLFR